VDANEIGSHSQRESFDVIGRNWLGRVFGRLLV